MTQSEQISLRLPERLTVTVQSGGRPASGIMLRPVFLARARNDFSIEPRASDALGQAAWTQDEIREWVSETARLFPRDHGDFDSQLAGEIRVEILGERDLDWLERAAGHFGEKARYPENFMQTVNDSRRALARLEAALTAEVAAEGEHDFQLSAENLAGFRHAVSYERKLLADVEGYGLDEGAPEAG